MKSVPIAKSETDLRATVAALIIATPKHYMVTTMAGSLSSNIRTTVKDPSILPLYAKWILCPGRGPDKAIDLDDLKITGFPSFSSYLGAHRNRPSKAELAFFARYISQGSTVFDVGANYGLMAMRMAQFSGREGRVFALEPIPDTFHSLERNVARNGFHWIDCIELALGASPGKTGFTNTSDPATNRMSVESELIVDIDTLDVFCTRTGVNEIDFLKIDVEGAEIDVLDGAQGLLQCHGIRAGMIEVCPGNLACFGKTPESLFDAVARYDYILSWVEDPDTALTRDAFRELPADFLGNAAFHRN